MIDDLFHTIIDVADIATEVLDERRSFVNASYDSTRVRHLEDGSIYTRR